MSGWLDALLGRIASNGVALALGKGINFKSNLQAVFNPSTQYVDVEVVGAQGPTGPAGPAGPTGATGSTFAGSTSIIIGADAQRAALTGAITAAQNSNVTALGSVGSTSIVVGSDIQRAALTGVITAAQNSNTCSFGAGVGSTSVVNNAGSLERAALTGVVTASQNSNTTAFASIAAKSVLANTTNSSAAPGASAPALPMQVLRSNAANTALEWSGVGTAVETAAGSATNSAAAIDLTGTLTIPANTLAVGSRFKASATYRFTRGSTATALTLNADLAVGASSLNAQATSAANTTNTFSGTVKVEADFTVVSTGAGGTARANVVTYTDCDNTATNGKIVTAFNATFAIDTTTPNAMKLRGAMGSAVANTTILATGGEIVQVR